MKLYHAPLTRSVRILWLLDELGLECEVTRMGYQPPERPFSQPTPVGKFPVLEDDGDTIFESGAIVEYLIERYGNGRLAPAPGHPGRAHYLQWMHYAEGTFFGPITTIANHTMFKPEADRIPALVDEAREHAVPMIQQIEDALADGRSFLLGEDFSGADIMLGYGLMAAKMFGILDERFPKTSAYFDRLASRPAYQKAIQP